ncbi:MAG: hypothetical protein NTW93_08600 [Phycisphaerae bacterium]|nr:hypothetical protein [Phycisphaerae bacterium]
MAVARQGQSNTTLYTVITFVALFVIAATLAVIFYLKSEDWRDQYTKSQQETSELASQNQVRNIGTLVGQKDRGQSRLGQLLGYIDQLYIMFGGGQSGETSAEVKMTEMQTKYNDILAKLPKDLTLSSEANQIGALQLLETYDTKLKQKQELADQLGSQLDELNKKYDLTKQESAKREEELRTQIRAEQKKADDIQQSCSRLDKKGDEQLQSLKQQANDAVEEKNKTKQELLAVMSKLSVAENKFQESLDKQRKLEDMLLKPRPMEDVAAYQPDGHIIGIDISSNIVFIDIGRDDKVYPGMTFSVYDKSASIPTDGSSKAEVEVFNVDKNTSIARINKSSKKNPIIEGDVIVNLIWDSKAVNRFVVAGEFDFNGDGDIDSDGAAKIKELIENWGGKVEDAVTIDTDFVVLGAVPQANKKPTLDEIQADPMATEKYEASVKASERYQEVKNQAKDFSIPVFNTKRFLNFVGYGSLASGKKAK